MPALFLVIEEISNHVCLVGIRRVDCEQICGRPFEQRTDVVQLVSDLLARVKRVPEPGAEDKSAGGLYYTRELVAGVGLNDVRWIQGLPRYRTAWVRVIETAALRIELEEGGPADGPPVLLLHGWPDAPRGWRPLGALLHERGWRTLAPALRGTGGTLFKAANTPRDGRGVALAADAIDLLDALELDRVPVIGHDWGARVVYTLAAVARERVCSIVALALAYQPRGVFTMPAFEQARAFWYQWLMYLESGASAVAADPIAFARVQWENWSPPGWFDDAEFESTARSFRNPDWVSVTLNAYRSRFLQEEPRDPRYDTLAHRLAEVETIATPTLMVQGCADRCDLPSASTDQERFFTGGYERLLLDGVGHFPHREAPERIVDAIHRRITSQG